MTSHPRCSDMEEKLHIPGENEHNMNSPLPFLSGVPKDRVEAIHKLLLCDLQPQWKNTAIEAVFEKKDMFLDKFNSWKWKISQLSGSSDEETIFNFAKESLKTWLAKRQHHSDKRKVDTEDVESVSKKMRTDEQREAVTVTPSLTDIPTNLYAGKKGDYGQSDPVDASKHTMTKHSSSTCQPCCQNHTSSKLMASPILFSRNDKASNQETNTHKEAAAAQITTVKPTIAKAKPIERKRSRSRQRFPNRQLTVKSTNILLLGETGVGKTTFINSFANYLRYETLEDALAGEPVILVDAAFTITDKRNKMITIEAKANTGADHKMMKGNERLGGKGTSSTQDPVDHIYKWLDNGEEKCVRIIDTPGINDTRGTEQDAQNFEAILEHIADIGELHAICILMKPNECKLTVGFRYCIDELLVKLHKNATKNILFCFTNTRSSLYRPGDTLATLHEYLKQLEKDTGVLITADRTNIFCYDNDCFRFLCMLRQLPKLENSSQIALFSDGWIHNIRESEKMLTKVQGMSAHSVEDTVAINNTRKLVTALARPLAEIAKNHVVNMKVIQERVEEIEKFKATGTAVKEKMYQEQTVIETVKLSQPRTVCTSPQCVTYVKINEHQTQSIPKIICHDNCYLTNVPEQCLNNKELANCKAFKNGLCDQCECQWQKHMHIYYEIKHVKEKVMDQTMKYRLECSLNKKKEAEKFLKEEKDNLQQMEREHDTIRDSCVEFAAFLATNSIKHTSDPYDDYLAYLLEDELNKLSHGGGSEFMSIALCDMLEYYKKKLGRITEEIKAGKRNALTASELKKQIDNLSRLKICGPVIAQLKDLHLQEVRASDLAEDSDHDVEDSRTEISNRFKSLSVVATTSSNSLFGTSYKDTSRF